MSEQSTGSIRRQVTVWSVVTAATFVVCILGMIDNPQGAGLVIFGGLAAISFAGFVWLRTMATRFRD